MSTPPSRRIDVARHAAEALQALRSRRPFVHCLTNPVAMTFTANVLLAAGARPSMTQAADTVADFVRSADALLINLGMLDPARLAAAEVAAPLASGLGKPWVLDPVKVERSPARLADAERLLEHRPSVVRGNAGEIEVLMRAALRRFGPGHEMVWAATGAIDTITDGRHLARLANGSPLMDRVTAVGCASSGLLAGFLGVEPDPLRAATAALAVVGVAGEIAAGHARGPGTFVAAFIDVLAEIDAGTLEDRVRLA